MEFDDQQTQTTCADDVAAVKIVKPEDAVMKREIKTTCTHQEVFKYECLAENGSGTEIKVVCRKGQTKTVVVVGHPGSGKTSLLRKLMYAWRDSKSVFEDKTVIWWLDLSQSDHCRVDSVESLAALQTISTSVSRQKVVRETLKNRGQQIVLIIDNFRFKSNDFVTKLLTKSILPECSILVAVEYHSIKFLPHDLEECDLFEMKGLEKDDVCEAMTRKGQELKVKSLDRIVDYIRSNTDLLDLCRNPSLMLKVLEIFTMNKCQCPNTVTSLVKNIVDKLVEASIGVLTSETEEQFISICSLAFDTQLQEEYEERDFSSLLSNLSAESCTFGLGLMQILDYRRKISYKFVHKTVKTYLAALYVQRKPIFDQAYLILRHSSNEMMLAFYYGVNLVESSSLNIAKMVLYPVLESLADKLLVGDSGTASEKVQVLFRCLHEAQEPNLVRKFLSRRRHLISLPLDDRMFNEHTLQMLSYCMAHSGIKKWKIEVSSEKLYWADYLKMLVGDQLPSELKSQFQLKVECGFDSRLSAVPIEDIPPSVKSQPNVYSRITRELLHRLLQLHSQIKLKSDGSNSSYVSILACQCLQNEMEAHEVLTLEPITATHWLPMKSKSSNQREENQQTLLHMKVKHDSQHTEFVVMMTPYPHRINFIMPGTKENLSITLCSYDSPDFLSSGIEHHLHIQGAPLMPLIYTEKNFNANLQQLVLPNMPLPKKTPSRAQTVAPAIPEPPRASLPSQTSTGYHPEAIGYPVAASTQALGNTTNRCKGHNSRVRDAGGGGGGGGGGAFGNPFNCTNGSGLEQTTQESQPQRQKPGSIIHTVIPEVFATDQQYPLPDERHLLRKGGNGEIFLGVFGDMELIVKKTSFRNREFLIHSKLKHNNVIQLLALMMGEKNSSQRRRMTCYHLLPKATGDLARLAVDDEQNTLQNLRIKHGNDPRTFGLVQGNQKFILTQILKGLSYLHGLNIVHRDLKASNVLLTFHCACFNPFTCGCAKKCAVQICDFDSAVQLTEKGLLPPSSVSKIDQTKATFTVTPVGTMGYRPPESSQLTISNDVSIISPSVTTKSDLWSFGVLVMKMTSGRYGPASQRELSTLLLYYLEEERWRVNTSFSKLCGLSDTVRVLKLSKLQEELHWNLKAVDCITECLKVDPNRRKSAEELLRHPFLY